MAVVLKSLNHMDFKKHATNPKYSPEASFSSVPEALVRTVAPQPGQLCPTCEKIDFAELLRTPPLTTIPDYNARHLGSWRDVLQRGDCSFCHLAREAFRTQHPGAFRDAAPRISKSTGLSPRCWLTTSLAGTYYSADGEKHDVSQLTLYTDECTTLDGGPDQRYLAHIRLLANDAHILRLDPMYQGRLIGNHASPQTLWNWIQGCLIGHKTCYLARKQTAYIMSPKAMRFVDVENMCITKPTFTPIYIALSYVWGGTELLQLKTSNLEQLQKEGCLTGLWDKVPAVIQDAIELVSSLNDRLPPGFSDDRWDHGPVFLWVDQLCIVQDDLKDKHTQIAQMDHVFADALATIVAASGANADQRLSRKHEDEVSFSQVVENIKGLRLVVALPDLDQILGKSPSEGRAWTFQESQLSFCALYLTEEQIFCKCSQDLMMEDLVCETPGTNTAKGIEPPPDWYNPHKSSKLLFTVGDKWPDNFEFYAGVVEKYTGRSLTFSQDVLAAFVGIQNSLQYTTDWRIRNGMPDNVLDFMLLWRPNFNNLRRRFLENGDIIRTGSTPPTYCWAAWLGPITFDRPLGLELRSLITKFEIVRMKGKKAKTERIIRRVDSDVFNYGGDWESDFPGRPYRLKPRSPSQPWITPADPNVRHADEMIASFENLTAAFSTVAFKAGITKTPFRARDGPCILRFQAAVVRLAVGGIVDGESFTDEPHVIDPRSCARLWVWDSLGRRVGTVWAVDQSVFGLGQSSIQVEFILLSQTREKETFEQLQWMFDSEVGSVHESCMTNVMLVKRVQQGKFERVTIGKIHENCAAEAVEEVIELV
jgi:Heterokaryon incompatibility protein (HET)